RRRQLGDPVTVAAIVGTEEVQGAITASTLTTIAVFGPIIYIEGVAGELFGALSFAVAFSLLCSLLVAVTVLPMLAAVWAGDPAGADPTAGPRQAAWWEPVRVVGGPGPGTDAPVPPRGDAGLMERAGLPSELSGTKAVPDSASVHDLGSVPSSESVRDSGSVH